MGGHFTPPPPTHTHNLLNSDKKQLQISVFLILHHKFTNVSQMGWRWGVEMESPPSPQGLIHCPQYMTLTFSCYVHVLSSDLDCSQINKPSLFVLRKTTKVKLLGRDTQLKKSHLCYWEPEIVDGMYTYAWYITIYDYSIMDHLMLQCEGCTIIGKEHYTCISVFW